MINTKSFENLSINLQPHGRGAKWKKMSIRILSNVPNIEYRRWIFLENDGEILCPFLKLIFNVHYVYIAMSPFKGKKILMII